MRSTTNSVKEVEVVDRDPAVAPVRVINREQDRRENGGLHQVPLQIKSMGSTVRLSRDLGRSRFLVGPDAERQQHERAERENQEVDGNDRGEGHQATWSNMTSTSGFLPVQSVAQRRTARRTSSRSFSALPPARFAASAAAAQASSTKAARSSSTGTPWRLRSTFPARRSSRPSGTATEMMAW